MTRTARTCRSCARTRYDTPTIRCPLAAQSWAEDNCDEAWHPKPDATDCPSWVVRPAPALEIPCAR